MNVSVLETPVAATPPKVTVAPGPKPEPSIVTRVPPAVVPAVGLTDVIVGGRYENPFARVAGCPSAFVTTASTAPGACGAVVTLIVVGVIAMTAAGTPPSVTVLPWKKLAP